MTLSICKFGDCLRPHYGNGLCNPHWQQERLGKVLTPIRRVAEKTFECAYDGCDRRPDRRGWCQMHYKQILRGDELRPIRAKRSQRGVICYLPHCDKPAVTADLCKQHAGISYNFDTSRGRAIELFSDPKCQICGAGSNGKRELHIDHDHAHGCEKGCDQCVRGLLCNTCNQGLGFFRDNTTTLKSAIDYLEKSAA